MGGWSVDPTQTAFDASQLTASECGLVHGMQMPARSRPELHPAMLYIYVITPASWWHIVGMSWTRTFR